MQYSDSLAEPELLLELIVRNNNSFGLMIKRPFMRIVDIDKLDTTEFNEVFDLDDFAKIPSEKLYEDSVMDPSRNPFFFKLEDYVMDSLKDANIKLDSFKANDIYGYSFINRNQNSVFLLNLTVFLNKRHGRFKIFPYYDSILYDYSTSFVPAEFEGYKKIVGDIKFDTFYLESNRGTK